MTSARPDLVAVAAGGWLGFFKTSAEGFPPKLRGSGAPECPSSVQGFLLQVTLWSECVSALCLPSREGSKAPS